VPREKNTSSIAASVKPFYSATSIAPSTKISIITTTQEEGLGSLRPPHQSPSSSSSSTTSPLPISFAYLL
jgi:hypothetical protein